MLRIKSSKVMVNCTTCKLNVMNKIALSNMFVPSKRSCSMEYYYICWTVNLYFSQFSFMANHVKTLNMKVKVIQSKIILPSEHSYDKELIFETILFISISRTL